MKKNSVLQKILMAIIRVIPIIAMTGLIWFFAHQEDWIDLALIAGCGLCIVWLMISFWGESRNRLEDYRRMQKIITLMYQIPIAILFANKDGELLWKSRTAKSMQVDQSLLEEIEKAPVGESKKDVSWRGREYELEFEKTKGGNYCLAIMMPKAQNSAQMLTEDALPVVGYIQIDNYDEWNEKDRASLRIVTDTVESAITTVGGAARRYDNGKFFVVLDRAALKDFQDKNFALLDTVRNIKTQNGVSNTITIAMGAEKDLRQTLRSASQALELALGRGGDQALVKEDGNYQFFGGKLQQGERYSKVKSRVFAGALGNLMSQFENVLIMGHKMADMDALGAAIGMVGCAKAQGKPVHIVLDESNAMIEPFLDYVKKSKEYDDILIDERTALTKCSEKTLAIVVDTQRLVATACVDVVRISGAVVVIDHHVRGPEGNISATLQLAEPHASSSSELVCEVLQYFKPEVNYDSITASALLCGMTVDTKNFTKNTSARTFEAAAFLRKHGASASFVRMIFMEDREAYMDRALIVGAAQTIAPGIVLSLTKEQKANTTLICAQAADALTTIKGIEAAFVLSKAVNDHDVYINARSSEDVNVQLILESLGGGGHFNASGAKLENVDLETAKQMVIGAVEKYMLQLEKVKEMSEKSAEPFVEIKDSDLNSEEEFTPVYTINAQEKDAKQLAQTNATAANPSSSISEPDSFDQTLEHMALAQKTLEQPNLENVIYAKALFENGKQPEQLLEDQATPLLRQEENTPELMIEDPVQNQSSLQERSPIVQELIEEDKRVPKLVGISQNKPWESSGNQLQDNDNFSRNQKVQKLENIDTNPEKPREYKQAPKKKIAPIKAIGSPPPKNKPLPKNEL